MKMLTVFGAGILIGTALNVIIPEGLHMWRDASSNHVHGHEAHEASEMHGEEGGHGHEGRDDWMVGASIAVGFAFMLLVDRVSGEYGHSHSGLGDAAVGSAADSRQAHRSGT